ncbi:HlyD family secretion protein [Oxalobacteraceae bacterium GrIS 1.11]
MSHDITKNGNGMNKKLLAAVVALSVLGLGLAWYLVERPSAEPGLVLYGNVDVRQVALAFNGSERIMRLSVREGERVRVGQELGQLDDQTLTLEIGQAQAQLLVRQQVLLRLKNGARPEEIAQARANLAAADAEARHAGQQLAMLQAANAQIQGLAVSRQDIDSAVAAKSVAGARLDNVKKALELALAGPRREEVGEARAQVDAAQAQVGLLRHRLAETVLKAPVDAVVRSRLLEPGDMASPQKPAFALAILDPKWVRAYVREADLGLLKPGLAARVSSDSEPGAAIAGRVGYISSVAEFTPKTVQTEEIRTSLVYEVRILVDDPQDKLRLGMPATVLFVGAARAGAARP